MRGKASGRYRPGRRGGEAEQGQGWLTTYADAVTLLLAFFVLLFSLAEMDLDKFAEFLAGLRSPFGNEAAATLLPERDELPPETDPGVAVEADELLALRDALQQLEEAGLTELDRDLVEEAERLVEVHEQLDRVDGEVVDALADRGFDDLVETRRDARGLVISITADDVLFELGSTEIGPAGRQVVEVVAEVLASLDNAVEVEGHTDDVPLQRPGYSNWNLSTDRAVAVVTRMIEEHGLAPHRIGAVGFGEHRPVADNETPEGRAQNRRVDVVVLAEDPRGEP